MEKITKKKFVDSLAENMTVFFGAVQHPAAWCDERMENAIKDTFDGESIIEHRYAKKHSNSLEFSGGNYLYFDQKCNYTFYHAEKLGYDVYMCEMAGTYSDGVAWSKTMVYVVDNCLKSDFIVAWRKISWE